MPGLIVLDIEILFTYVPLDDDGFNFIIVFISSLALSFILSAENETFPTEACTIPVLSTLKSILPPLISLIAFPISIVTGPVLGFGIRPLGPKTFQVSQVLA